VLTEHQSGGKMVWVDLYNPTNEEIGKACTDYQLDIPPREQLEEIEFSSRLQYEDGVFTISVPVTPHQKPGNGEDVTSPSFTRSKPSPSGSNGAHAAPPTSSW
jgi:magnesium transporter